MILPSTTKFFFFNDTATTEIYTLSLHDALPIFFVRHARGSGSGVGLYISRQLAKRMKDRKSTRLNSSHVEISYAVFCLKKKKHVTFVFFVQSFFLDCFFCIGTVLSNIIKLILSC